MFRYKTPFFSLFIFLSVSLSQPNFSSAQRPDLSSENEILFPPTYWGKGDGLHILPGGTPCGKEFETIGFEPSAEAADGYPLFLYLPGTSERYNGDAPKKVLQAMARRGFVAFSADYQRFDLNSFPAILESVGVKICKESQQRELAFQRRYEQATSFMFDPNRKDSLVGTLCSRSKVNCSKGIAIWGYSQGGGLALRAAAYDQRVGALWLTGVGSATPWSVATMLHHSQVRIVNGSTDPNASDFRSLNQLTGRSCGKGQHDCLNGEDGSGWYLVQPKDLKENGRWGHAGHCWFNMKNDFSDKCVSLFGAVNLDSNWLPADADGGVGGKPFSVDVNGDWLKDALKRYQSTIEEGAVREIAIDFNGFDYKPSLLPFPLVESSYPVGVVAWSEHSNFKVCGPYTNAAPCAPDQNVFQNYAVIGSDSSEQTGVFSFAAPQGWELESMTLYNSSPFDTSVTTRVFRTDGSFDSQTDSIPGRTREELPFCFGGNVQTVIVTIGNGVQTKIENLQVYGSAPTIVEPVSTCPAKHIALLASNGRYVSLNPLDPNDPNGPTGPLQATALRPGKWETFTCVDDLINGEDDDLINGEEGHYHDDGRDDLLDGMVALKLGDRFVRSNGTSPTNNSLYISSDGPTIPGKTETFNYIDLGNGEVVLRASNGRFVSADLSLPRAQLVANRSQLRLWERFQIVPLP